MTTPVEADYELTAALRRYQAFYLAVHGGCVSEADLLREMARRFMADDKGFQEFGHNTGRSKRKKSAAPNGDADPCETFNLDPLST